MDGGWARDRFVSALVARLATADDQGQPHVVPIVYAVIGPVVYSTVDHKPKTGNRLRRLDNIDQNPQVSVLVDHYADDWTQLWWARADGTARLLERGSDEAVTALAELARRYPAYVEQPPPGPVIAIDVRRWSGWTSR
jgi:PPOX class probable F420-dependent enzyme